MFSAASARPTGLAVKSARSTNGKSEAEQIPAMFNGFLDHNGNGADGVGENACIVYVAFKSMGRAQ